MSISIVRRCVPGMLLAASLTGCAGAAAATAPPPPGPPNAVGTQPAVQRWFERTQPQQIALQNALEQAYVQLAQGTGNGCASLDAAAAAVLQTLPSPKRALDAAVSAGIADLRTGAEQCLAGDPAAARRSLAAGAAARAKADTTLDDILEAPNAGVN
jgi:hypothetical protein